jgi:hypothetical protein
MVLWKRGCEMFHDATDIRNFVLAGKAVITLESKKTGKHYTYRIRQATDHNGNPTNRWFVSLLTGPDNTRSYTYLGLIDGDEAVFRLTAKSKMTDDAPPVAGFRFMWRWVNEQKAIPDALAVRHDGHCGRCHRPLTVPESIDRGLGPECYKRAA